MKIPSGPVQLFFAALALAVPAGATAASDAVALRVEALLSQMTLDEKIGQMTQADSDALKKNPGDVQKYFLGSVLSGGNSDAPDLSPAGWARFADEFQAQALKTRLKIPILYGIDAVHGHNNVDGATVFPHNVGLGASRDAQLVEQAARATAAEVAGTGIRWTFAPCLAVPRDERWGRTYEGFGEMPELVSELGAAAVRGFQGPALSPDPSSVLACAKHFMGDGGTSNGVDQGDTVCDEATLRRLHLPGYRAAIGAGAGSVMISYNSWNGQKMHGQKHLITDVLKGELGFAGFAVSDWAAIDQLGPTYKDDIEASINAGLDMIMIPNAPGQKNSYVDFITGLKALVQEGRVPLARVDDAVRRILRVKVALGVFEHPMSDPALTAQVGSAAHRAVARACVSASLVLLKNERHALPLSKRAKRIVVAGRGADDIGMQCGGWTLAWQGAAGSLPHGGTTILSALRQAAPGAKVERSPDGANIAGADAAVVVIGETPYAEMKGDRADLALAPEDVALVQKAKAAGVPVVVVLLSGRPLIVQPALEAADAFVAAWLPGTEGQGVADVLFGNAKPRGKLPHSWPRSMAQIPINAGDPVYDPLFPYGFGLSY